jgi:hypothetical protein
VVITGDGSARPVSGTRITAEGSASAPSKAVGSYLRGGFGSLGRALGRGA